MGQRIVKQPNGLYGIFSSITDSYILCNATPEMIIKERIKEAKEKIKNEVLNEISENNKRKLEFDESLKTIQMVHGKNSEELKWIKKYANMKVNEKEKD